MNWAQVFKTAAESESKPRGIRLGSHALTFESWESKTSEHIGTYVEAWFTVLWSTVHEPGDRVAEAWFVGAPSFAGAYAAMRAKAFLVAMMRTVPGYEASDMSEVDFGNPDAFLAELGAGLHNGKIDLEVEVTEVKDSQGNVKRSRKGLAVLNTTWNPIATQNTLDEAIGAAERIAFKKQEAGLDIDALKWMKIAEHYMNKLKNTTKEQR